MNNDIYSMLNEAKINLEDYKKQDFNDMEIIDFINLTKDIELNVRFIEMMPIGEGKQFYDKGIITANQVIERIPQLVPIKSKEKTVAKVFAIENHKGNIGFITPLSCKFCDECNKIRITSTGTLKPCLHSKQEINLKPYLNNEEELLSLLKISIFDKPKEHFLSEENVTRTLRRMNQIGG